ncbi:hypothetical protein C8R45DRAFT_1125142 [Mycena sanguinolenta]|nr:hypothetical protein C8R45DRAFT_1125142 [Mycena sanguinolenta]
MATLLDLPNEILICIERLSNQSLHALAKSSRRLHFVALPVFFSRSTEVDLDAGTIVCALGTAEDAFFTLEMCLFVHSLKHIKCVIPQFGSGPVAQFFRELKRMHNFIARLESVNEVSLYLASSPPWPLTLCSIPLRTAEEFRAWAEHVGDLVNCIIQRECDTLTIVEGSLITFTPVRPAPVRPGLLDRMLRRFAPRSSNQRPPSMPSFPGGASRLTTLIIDSETLVIPAGIDWVLGALRQAPITQSGVAMARADKSAWSTFLPQLAAAAPNLTVLVFTEVAASVEPVVLSVLERFPKLTNLHISHPRPLYDPPYAPQPALRYLSALRAPPTTVQHLLAPKDALPELRELCVLWRAPPGLNLESLLFQLGSIGERIRTRKRIPHLTLEIHVCGCTAEDALLRADVASNTEITAARARVERLHIELDGGTNDRHGIERLAALFPTVSDVLVSSTLSPGLTTRMMMASADSRVVKDVRAMRSLGKSATDDSFDGYHFAAHCACQRAHEHLNPPNLVSPNSSLQLRTKLMVRFLRDLRAYAECFFPFQIFSCLRTSDFRSLLSRGDVVKVVYVHAILTASRTRRGWQFLTTTRSLLPNFPSNSHNVNDTFLGMMGLFAASTISSSCRFNFLPSPTVPELLIFLPFHTSFPNFLGASTTSLLLIAMETKSTTLISEIADSVMADGRPCQ